ncbi:DUF3265 domain-containing protein [Vibrio anguillarum]|nr:DUF3265 domain-containing protein [Vibrio anguillarum]ASG09276.1 DUF3265 domain-containing protein [Vibrio anguillarum]
MTKRSRGTWHAWHFRIAVCLVVKVLCGNFCIACLRPLTRRYILSRSVNFPY